MVNRVSRRVSGSLWGSCVPKGGTYRPVSGFRTVVSPWRLECVKLFYWRAVRLPLEASRLLPPGTLGLFHFKRGRDEHPIGSSRLRAGLEHISADVQRE